MLQKMPTLDNKQTNKCFYTCTHIHTYTHMQTKQLGNIAYLLKKFSFFKCFFVLFLFF